MTSPSATLLKHPLLACGCTAMAIHKNEHNGLGVDHPSCFVHDCCVIVEKPSLVGRMARCSYFVRQSGPQKPWRNSGPIYGGGDKTGLCENGGQGCRCLVPSDYGLPFFSYHEEKSEDEFFCGCAGWD